MIIILGIDPGSLNTGYGIISCSNHTINYINSGSIKLLLKNNFYYKLKFIYNNLKKIINNYNPNISVLEHIFICKNYNSIIKLSYARAIILLVIIKKKIPLFEYSCIKIKYIITGLKNAKKQIIQKNIQMKFKFTNIHKKDESDALAIALTYYYINIYKINFLKKK